MDLEVRENDNEIWKNYHIFVQMQFMKKIEEKREEEKKQGGKRE